MTYLERLAARVEAVGNCLCVGLDPDPAALPRGFPQDLTGVERLAGLVIDAALAHAAAIKVNLAFFESFGSPGMAALERLRARIPADLPFIADAKRADIGSTAARQAVALYEILGADAVTASPYLGGDAIAPLLERADRFVYVLCRTSNPGAGELQDLAVAGEPLYLHVARRAGEWAAARANVGLVVGATAPSELAQVRRAAPALAFLVPGVGAQGGDIAAVLEQGPAVSGAAAQVRGGALLVNISRGITSAAAETPDPHASIADSIGQWALRLRC